MSEPVGIIYPPPELRGIVDSTAKYVAKNGGAFEERIMREHKGKPKFSFLFSDDPFNAYYKHKVREIRNAILNEEDSKRTNSHDNHNNNRSHQEDESNNHQSNNDDSQYQSKTHLDHSQRQESSHHGDDKYPAGVSEGQDGQETYQSGEDDEQSNRDELAPRVKPKLGEYMQEITMKLEEPPILGFIANPASSSTHFECDIIKLTAKFIALHGRQFLLELVSREQGNQHFDFLKPQHGQFPYMTRLIMQYALVQNPPLDILEQLRKDSTSQKHVIDRIRMRAEWNKMLEVERLKMEEAERREKDLYSQIDWHDFVIVETIDYKYDEVGEYPSTTPDQVGTRLLQQQRKEDHHAPEEMEIDMDVESDQEESDEDNVANTDSKFVVPNPPDLSKIIIRRDYDPKAATKTTAQPDNYFVSPITNERIPVDKIHEHVRYNLVDPRYLEKKEQMLQDKIKEDAVFASGSQIQDSLKNLAERRTDIFGMNDTEAEIGRRIGEEEQEKSKNNKLIWDGHKSSLKKKKTN